MKHLQLLRGPMRLGWSEAWHVEASNESWAITTERLDGPTIAPEQQEEQVDSRLSFLGTAQADLLSGILGRRNPPLSERLGLTSTVSRVDAEAIMSVISDEFVNNLDDDWEPTEYGREVSALLAQFNAARVSEWP